MQLVHTFRSQNLFFSFVFSLLLMKGRWDAHWPLGLRY